MNPKREKLRQEALRKAAIYQKLFDTVEGREILADLEREFENRTLAHEKPHLMHMRVGELNVVRYIKSVLQVDIQALEERSHE